jgi:HlyD family secretion protein
MPDNKTDLLRTLEINRSSPAAQTRSARPSAGRWILPTAGLILILGAAAWFALPMLESREAESKAVKPAPAAAASATPAPVAPASDLIASGYVVARRKATVAAEITGKVVDVFVEEGMVVAEGQELARLDSALAEADLANSKARVASAEAAIQSNEADLVDAIRIAERTRNLQARNYATEADLTKNEARVAVLRAQIRKSQADLLSAKAGLKRDAETLDKHHIRAPFAGVVVDKNAQMGEMISPLSAGGGFTRTGVCTIVDMDSLEIEVDVNEAFINRVTEKQKVQAVLDAYPDWTIPAQVIAIVPTANRDKATIKVRIGLLVKDPRILPDMAVKTTFVTAAK